MDLATPVMRTESIPPVKKPRNIIENIIHNLDDINWFIKFASEYARRKFDKTSELIIKINENLLWFLLIKYEKIIGAIDIKKYSKINNKIEFNPNDLPREKNTVSLIFPRKTNTDININIQKSLNFHQFSLSSS